jgi:hypothetical protein
MTTAKHIYDEVRNLPESQAQEVLYFVTRLKAKHLEDMGKRRNAALSALAMYRGRFEVAKATLAKSCMTAESFADSNIVSTHKAQI